MAMRVFALASVVALGFIGLAQAQSAPVARQAPTEQGAPAAAPARDPAPQGAPGPGATTQRPAPENAEAAADQGARRGPVRVGRQDGSDVRHREGTERRAARAERPRTKARAERRPSEYRSARYQGGRGATWKTGRDSYGFGGSFGGCDFRGHAGPNGYRVDRSC